MTESIRRLLAAMMVTCALLALASPVSAQDDWSRPVQGIAEAIFAGQKLGVLLVTPADDAASKAVEELIRRQLLASGFAEIVMDDAPLGDVSAKSDDEIIAAAKAYPVDVVVVLRTFPGANGPSAVLRIESTANIATRTFRLQPGQPPPPWNQPPTPSPVVGDDPAVVAQTRATDVGRQQAAMTRMGALGLVETMRLVSAEHERRQLAFEARPKSPVVRDPGGAVVPWPDAYERMGRPELALSYRRRTVTSTAAMAAGAIFGAAGIGMLFVGLANQANCGTESGCGRPTLLIFGASSAVVGAAAIVTGLLIRRHRTPTDELETLVEEHNRDRR